MLLQLVLPTIWTIIKGFYFLANNKSKLFWYDKLIIIIFTYFWLLSAYFSLDFVFKTFISTAGFSKTGIGFVYQIALFGFDLVSHYKVKSLKISTERLHQELVRGFIFYLISMACLAPLIAGYWIYIVIKY